MPSSTEFQKQSTPSSPSLSLADFDYDSDSPEEQVPIKQSTGISHSLSAMHIDRNAAVASPFISPDLRNDVATQSDIAALRELIQRKFQLMGAQISNQASAPTPTPAPVPVPMTVAVPAGAFTDSLRAELALQMAKVSILEEEVRSLRSEKQGLRAELDRAENSEALRAELDIANEERKRLHVERQGLWDERADLWRERQTLWEERGDLWKERGDLWQERGDLWVLRDSLLAQVESLTQAEAKPKAD
ncbi:hypothetical protein BDV93DRAFT_609654 [Ceratobasidium sp. AG-I]|nr:hypothetical protein BDV93DRAFT_609654 [Ceratobasidium sp. AG-I]